MSDSPVTLLSHTLVASPPQDAVALRAAIEDRLPGLDLRVAHVPPETRELIGEAEVMVTASLAPDVLGRAPELRWVQAVSSGVDAYPLDRLTDEGVVLTNAAGVHGEPIAEHVLGTLLYFERDLRRAVAQQRRRTWERYDRKGEERDGAGELRGKTLGIVGVGAVGTRLAAFADVIGMRTLGVKRDPSTAPETVDAIHPPDDLYPVLTEADYLVIACPLTDETQGLIGAEELGAMKPSSVLVNIARGEIVDQDALLAQLQGRGIHGAALDVFEEEPLPPDSPLWDLPNVLVTPHMAGSSPANEPRIADVLARNYEAYARGDLEAMPTRLR